VVLVHREQPRELLATVAAFRADLPVAVVVVDNGIPAVVTAAVVGISATTGNSVHKAGAAVADTASSKGAATIRSVIRIMGVAVAARVARVNSRRPRPSRWCRRSR
jgi:hypothetical protein